MRVMASHVDWFFTQAEPERQERLRRARAGGYPIPGIEETLGPIVAALALACVLALPIGWEVGLWGYLAGAVVGLAAGYMGAVRYIATMAWRRDVYPRGFEERGEPYPPSQWPRR